MRTKIDWKISTVISLVTTLSMVSFANAMILFDGADTGGVTVDDTYVIDFDDTSATEITLSFGSPGTNYFRFDTVNSQFEISGDLDLESNQLINARVQNVAVLADVPSCAAADDRGKKVFVGGSTIANVNGAQTLDADSEYVCLDTNPAATRWVTPSAGGGGDAATLDSIDSTQFLRSDTTDNYTSGTLTFNSSTTVTLDAGANINLPHTDANTFTVNDNAANGESSTLSFGDGSGTIIWDDTAGNFTLNNSLVVSGGNIIELNLNQVHDLRLENVAALPGGAPGLGAGEIGRVVELTVADGVAPGCITPVCQPGPYMWAGAAWIYMTSGPGTPSNTFTLDNDNTTGDLSLQFGAALNENLTWDESAAAFTFTDDLYVQGDLAVLEGGASPTYYSIFQGGDQAGNVTYTLPTSQGGASTMLQNNGSGVLSWAAAGGSDHMIITFLAAKDKLEWDPMPDALQEMAEALPSFRVRIDLSNVTQGRLSANLVDVEVGDPGAILAIQYSTDQSTWNYLDGGTGPTAPVDTTGLQVGSFATITPAARADVYLRVVGLNGGNAKVRISKVQLEVK